MVRTVFTGATVDSFEAEIVGVVPGGRTEGTLIVARATGERVARTGIAAGMSGSPVYVGGRLAGALSTGWAFNREPFFGVTPIREMLKVLDQPAEDMPGPSSGPSGADPTGAPGEPRFRELRWDEPGEAADAQGCLVSHGRRPPRRPGPPTP